jgi:hypothetical protein
MTERCSTEPALNRAQWGHIRTPLDRAPLGQLPSVTVPELPKLATQALDVPAHVTAWRHEVWGDPTLGRPSRKAPGTDPQRLRGLRRVHPEPAETATGGRRVGRAAVVWVPGLAVALGAAAATIHGLYEVCAGRPSAGRGRLAVPADHRRPGPGRLRRHHPPARRSGPVCLVGRRAGRRPVWTRPSCVPRHRDHGGRTRGAAIRGRRLARGCRRHRRASALPPGHSHHRRAHVESKCSGGTVQTGWCKSPPRALFKQFLSSQLGPSPFNRPDLPVSSQPARIQC